MSRLRFILAAGLVALVAAAGSSAATPTLIGTTGPNSGLTIKLTKGGKKVTKLIVKDTANTHNFHLKGPGINKKTSVAGKGTQTWKVTLQKGKYVYLCDPHAKVGMKGSFIVT